MKLKFQTINRLRVDKRTDGSVPEIESADFDWDPVLDVAERELQRIRGGEKQPENDYDVQR